MSGTGKSTVLAELGRRGFDVVDTDYGGYAIEAAPFPGSPPEQRWLEDRIDELLTDHDEQPEPALFVAGAVANQGAFYPRFAAVVLLSAPVDVVLDRLARRTTNDFGKSPGDRERVLSDLAEVEPRLRAGADLEIDTHRPLSEVVDRLVRLAEELAPPASEQPG